MKKKSRILSVLYLLAFTTVWAQNSQERIPAKGLAVFEEKGKFQPYAFSWHPVGDNDIQIEILYAGICHSDLHHIRAEGSAVDEAYRNVLDGKVKFRYVIDMRTLK
ncbi:MAG: hypothetical protein LIP08_14230 [Bacteroides sp.]|nr:hypothetical protein [Bacteroides sp.]